MIRVAAVDPYSKAEEVIKQLLSPWNLLFSDSDSADVIVSYGTMTRTEKPTVVVPFETPEFIRWCEEDGLQAVNTSEKKLSVSATETVKLNIVSQTKCLDANLGRSEIRDHEPLLTQIDRAAYLLPFDLIKEYLLKLNQTLNPKVSSIYRFLTGLPIPYTMVPHGVRNFLLRSSKAKRSGPYSDHLDVDALWYLLVAAIERATGRLLQRRTWKGRQYACLVTHDIDTQEGLEKALVLKKLEERYDVPSACFLVTDTYKLDSEAVLKLADHGEVGVQDTKHDGKLIHLSQRGIMERLGKAKQTLERKARQDVVGFRAPLLQHSRNIMAASTDVGYEYDASIPIWEPMHPSTMGHTE